MEPTGPERDEDRPVNMWSRSEEEIGRPMSNFAHTPFQLDGEWYASVEGFWSALYYWDNQHRRDRVRLLWGARSKFAAPRTRPPTIEYRGEVLEVGSDTHPALMKRAIRAKLEAHPAIAARFVDTRPRPIVHELENGQDHTRLVRMLTEVREELAARLDRDGPRDHG